MANPIATILSVAMMLRYSLEEAEAADAIENAVREVLKEGYRTADIATENDQVIGTREMGKRIAAKI